MEMETQEHAQGNDSKNIEHPMKEEKREVIRDLEDNKIAGKSKILAEILKKVEIIL